MERSRDGYRGRYRDRHSNDLINRNDHDNRSTRGNYRKNPSNSNNSSSRNSPNSSYNYRSSRNSINSRPVSSRNGPSTHHSRYHNDDYSRPSDRPSSSNRTNSGQSNYYDNHATSSSSSRFDRSSDRREIYPSLLGEQPLLSNGSSSSSLYYPSSQSITSFRDRGLPLLSSQYVESDRSRYIPPSSSNYRRDNSPPSSSSYRNERPMDYGSRNTNNDIYMRNEYRLPSPPSLAPLSVRGDPYGDIYRTNDHSARSERYDIASNRINTSSRDYPMAPVSSSTYRSSSNVSIPSSSYMSHDAYASDINYDSISQPRDYGFQSSSSSSRTNYSSTMDYQEDLSRNSRDDHRSSLRDHRNLKRSGSRYNDNGPIPSKRRMRR